MTTLKQFASPTVRHALFALTRLVLLLLCVCLSGALTPSHAQETAQTTTSADNSPADTARAIELYKQGQNREAARLLRAAVKRRKDDAQAWLHLGIALTRAGESKDARKAFEKAIKLSPDTPQAHIGMAYVLLESGKAEDAEREATRAVALAPRNAESHYALGLVRMHQESPLQALAEADAALQFNPNFGVALILKKEAALEAYAATYTEKLEKAAKLNQTVPEISPEERQRLANFLTEGANSLEKFLKLFPAERAAPRLREELETLRLHGELVSQSDAPLIHQADAVTTKATIVSKPEPLYTEEARQNQVTGTVQLRMVLSFDGKVRHILVLHGLKSGLTQMAVNAARGIKFIPATKHGRPVSQFVTIEYNFNIY